MVVQELEARHTAQDEVVGLMLQVEPTVQQVALVAALVVVGNAADVVGAVFLALGHAGIFVRISALVGVFIVQGEVQLQVLAGQVDGTNTASELVVLVHPLIVQRHVLEETSLVLIEEVGGEGKLRADAVVVAHAGLVVVVGSSAQHEVRPLIGEGRLGEDTYQAAHRVASVERALRASHHVDTLDVGVVEVEGRLVDEGDVVHVETHGRRVDARTDAAYIDRSRQLRAIVGYEQIGHQRRQALDRTYGITPHVGLRERRGRKGLLAQTAVFLGCGDYHHFFDIHHLDGVFGGFFAPDNLRCSYSEQRKKGQNRFLHCSFSCFGCKVKANLRDVQSSLMRKSLGRVVRFGRPPHSRASRHRW